jgi:cupin domain
MLHGGARHHPMRLKRCGNDRIFPLLSQGSSRLVAGQRLREKCEAEKLTAHSKSNVRAVGYHYRRTCNRRDGSMIRCVRLWTGDDGDSHFEEGMIDLPRGERGDLLSGVLGGIDLSFQETASGGSYEWHKDPVPRFVVTLSGTLEFETRGGGRFTIRPGDILLAQDNTGTGHRWKLIGDEPWRRVYLVYPAGAALPFKANSTAADPA